MPDPENDGTTEKSRKPEANGDKYLRNIGRRRPQGHRQEKAAGTPAGEDRKGTGRADADENSGRDCKTGRTAFSSQQQ